MSDDAEETERNIPLPIQREVRQRCGFGCVVCGLPLYEYEHMEEWAVVKRHVAAEITLLCDQHHREKTGGLLPKDVVREADASPFNLRGGVSKPYDLHFSGDHAEIVIGGNTFVARSQGYGTILVPVSIDGAAMLGFVLGDGHLLLNFVLFDEFNRRILWIQNNRLRYTVQPWDIQLVGTTLTIREARKKILLEIEFAPPNKIHVRRGRFLRNGVEILIREKNLLVTNNSMLVSGNRVENVTAGIVIGPHDPVPPALIYVENVSRYTGDRRDALAFEKESMGEVAG